MKVISDERLTQLALITKAYVKGLNDEQLITLRNMLVLERDALDKQYPGQKNSNKAYQNATLPLRTAADRAFQEVKSRKAGLINREGISIKELADLRRLFDRAK